MKKLLLLVAVVAMVLPGCKKINEAIDGLDNRIDALENEIIPTIDEQISVINTTLDNLDAMDKELKGYIDDLTATASSLQEQINATNTKIEEVKAALQSEISTAKSEVLAQLEALETELKNELAQINATIETLKAKDAELDQKIADLKAYVDSELKNTTDWVSATFATLEQYNALCTEVATIKAQIEAINKSITDLESRLNDKITKDIAAAVATLSADIQQKVKDITDAYTAAIKSAKEEITAAYTVAIQTAISNLDSSLKAWVGEQLANYYTIAEIDAEIAAIEATIAEGDAALQEELNALKAQLDAMKTELTEAYKKAIEEAITENNGVINTKIANEIADVNAKIDSEVATINEKLAALQAQVDQNTADIAKLLARIQSVSYIPQYSDGKATVKYVGTKESSEVTLDFKVSPKECVAELTNVWKKAVKVESIYTQTRAVSFVDMPVQYFEADEATGVITIVASGKNLSDNFFAGTQSASVALAISDENNSVTTDYIPMVAKEVTDEIWYTSSNGAVVTPSRTDVFEADIVSNTYENGKGVITFDGDVTSIGYMAFYRCSSLTSITISDSVTEIGNFAFYDCSRLTSVTIPDSVTSIGAEAFHYCSSLTSITIPDSVTSIGNNAFSGCSNLTSVTIPDSVTSIRGAAFWGCSSLTSVTIPDSVTSIGGSAFSGCSSLTSVTVGSGVTEIGGSAFSGCTGELIINSKIVETDYTYSTYPAESSSGWLCGAKFTKLTIGDSITKIGNYVFYKYSSLTSVTIPDSVTSIGSYAFSGCSSLTAFYGKFASSDNRALIVDNCIIAYANASGTSYTIPDSVTSIGYGAFEGCSSLTSVTIPDSVTSIGESAFEYCSSLTSVYCKPTTPPTGGSNMFYSNASGRKIYVPTASVSAYKAASFWSIYSSYIVGYDF